MGRNIVTNRNPQLFSNLGGLRRNPMPPRLFLLDRGGAGIGFWNPSSSNPFHHPGRQTPTVNRTFVASRVKIAPIGRERNTANPRVLISMHIELRNFVTALQIPQANRIADSRIRGAVVVIASAGCRPSATGRYGHAPNTRSVSRKSHRDLARLQLPKPYDPVVSPGDCVPAVRQEEGSADAPQPLVRKAAVQAARFEIPEVKPQTITPTRA